MSQQLALTNTLEAENHVDQQEEAVVESTEPKKVIQIKREDETIMEFATIDLLSVAIKVGEVSRTSMARTIAQPVNKEGSSDEASAEVEWIPLEQFAKSNKEIDILYRPIWTYAMKGFWIAAAIGVGIKTIDTAATFGQINGGLALLFLLMGGLLAWVSIRGGFMPLALGAYLGFKYQINFVFFGAAWASTILVGGLYGGLIGLAIGTIVGYAKKKEIKVAPDASPEGKRPLLLGLVAPVVSLVVIAPLHFFWLNEVIIKWLNN